MLESGIVVAFAVGLLVLCIIGKIASLPIKLVWKFITNSIFGAFLLCIVNLFGLGIKITIFKALVAGVFGIPGVIAIVIFNYL
jgi:inhibitor of the pro-sigma K processing machinery